MTPDIETVIRDLGKCHRCNGDGEYLPTCFKCDDSTEDHECPGPRACAACEQTGLVKVARDALAAMAAPMPGAAADGVKCDACGKLVPRIMFRPLDGQGRCATCSDAGVPYGAYLKATPSSGLTIGIDHGEPGGDRTIEHVVTSPERAALEAILRVVESVSNDEVSDSVAWNRVAIHAKAALFTSATNTTEKKT